MANLHVIYDPTEKLEPGIHLPKEIKIAVMHIAKDAPIEEISEILDELASRLLQQVGH